MLDCGGRRGGPGRVAADWAGAGCAGPSGKERWAAGWAVVLERVLGWALFYFFLFFSILLLFQTKLKPFEFKFQFEFKPSTQTKKNNAPA